MTQASARSAAPLSALVVVPRSAPRSAAVTGLRSAHWSVGPWVPSPEQAPRPLHRHHRASTTDTSIRCLHCLPRRPLPRRRSITTRTERKLALSHERLGSVRPAQRLAQARDVTSKTSDRL